MENPAQPNELLLILLIRPFPFISSYIDIFSNKYRSLDPSKSPLPLPLFLTTHAQSVRALICAAYTPLTSEILTCLPSLQFVITTSTGVDHIDLNYCRNRGILVANAGDIFSDDVADFAVGLLLAVLRKVTEADNYVRRGDWVSKGDFPLGSKIGGKRVGIVGLGSIGFQVAKRLTPFNCKISYHSRTKKPTIPFPYYPNVHQLATNNDILIICCSLSKETHHIINKDVLSALGKDGIIINIGRGALIDEKEMVRCLVNKEIKGAGLDVFEDKPNVPKELLELENVVVAAHVAMRTFESLEDLHQHVMDNLNAFFSNKPLLSKVV